MNLKNIIAVSGLPGLYKLVSTKTNGLLVSDMDSGKTKFCSVRQHQFTPLETVAIYTEDDAVEIGKVFQNMYDMTDEVQIPAPNAEHHVLQKYFVQVFPEYDRDRVYHSDMKKIIKWYNFLLERGYITAPNPEEKSGEDTLEADNKV